MSSLLSEGKDFHHNFPTTYPVRRDRERICVLQDRLDRLIKYLCPHFEFEASRDVIESALDIVDDDWFKGRDDPTPEFREKYALVYSVLGAVRQTLCGNESREYPALLSHYWHAKRSRGMSDEMIIAHFPSREALRDAKKKHQVSNRMFDDLITQYEFLTFVTRGN